MLPYTDRRNSSFLASPLTARDLADRTYVFSLKMVLRANPGLHELLDVEEDESIMTVASGLFLPALLEKNLHSDPLLVCQSPNFLEEEIMYLPSRPTTFVDGRARDSFGWHFLGWGENCPVCVRPVDINDVLQKAIGGTQRIHVAFIAGDTFAIETFCIGDHFLEDMYEEGYETLPPEYREYKSADNWWREGNGNDCIGPTETCSDIMRVRRVDDNALLVSTRDVMAKEVTAGDVVDRELSVIWERLGDGAARGEPVMALTDGADLPSLIPEQCEDFPVLCMSLPEAMQDDMEALITSQLYIKNFISADLQHSQTMVSANFTAPCLRPMFAVTP